MLDNKQFWQSALNEIELEISKANFRTWFKNTHITKQDGGTIHIGVPNAFAKDWLCSKYNKLILKSLRDIHDGVRGVEYVICKETEQPGDYIPIMEQKNIINEQFPMQDLYVNKEDNLNPRYTFDSFIIGSFNELAHAAAQAIIRQPGVIYNPFFVYGHTGLGKTHLIQSIGNYLKKEHGKKVFYISSERFSLDYVNSVQSNTRNSFKEKYRKYDAFIMDDIQFLSGKEKTQEELFHLFNHLYENNKQIIFSSDKHHNYIQGLEERLKSRFGAGMIVDISPPDYESKVAIIKNKLKTHNLTLSNDIIECISSSLIGSIREMEGILNTIAVQTQIRNRSLNIIEVKDLIKTNSKPKKTISIQEVTKIVAEFYKIEESVIYEKTRRKEVVRPRQIAMYILREDFNTSFPLIGQKLGGRDHTTVIHAYEKIKGEVKKDDLLSQEISQIRAMF